MQDRLRAMYGPDVWVGNAGLDGHSTRGHILVMEKAMREVHPNVIIFLVGVNDFGLSLFGGESVFDGLQSPRAYSIQLYRLLWTYKRIALDEAVLVTGSGHRSLNLQPVDSADLTPLPDDLRELLPSLPEYRANLNRLIDIAEEEGIKVLFLTQPTSYADTPYYEQFLGRNYWIKKQNFVISAATYWRMLNLFNQELLAVCVARDVLCYDLAAEIPPGETYFYDAIHFNDVGADLVGDLVADAVADYLLEDDAGRAE